MRERLQSLCRGDAALLADKNEWQWIASCMAIIAFGCGLYGFVVGLWHAPLQAAFTAVKFPLLIFLTCAGNALLNGMLAQLLGSRLSFRQTSMAILASFALAALILVAFTPLALFILYNTPALASAGRATGHSLTLITHVGLIAYAGIVANRRLLDFVEKSSGSRRTGRRVLAAWLAGNLLLGSQLAWVLRPFIGSPGLPIQFLRDDPLRGNFFEAVFVALKRLLAT